VGLAIGMLAFAHSAQSRCSPTTGLDLYLC
jgi:hypothetical protein